MVQRIKQMTSLTGLLAIMVLFTGCDLGSSGSSMGTMEVRLHDAPANYDEVNVHVDSVQVNREGSDEGWITISTPDQTYDLLKLANGDYEVLSEAELETGTYHQIRLILGEEGHNVVIDGETHPITYTPSAQQTGVKLNVNAEIEEGVTYTLLLDFDASRSIVETGPQGYLLKPVIRATNEAATGNIEGAVSPAEAEGTVYAIANSDTLSTVNAAADGYFQLVGLEEGTYTVSVEPRAEGYQSAEVAGVEVTVGETTEVDTIEVQ